MTQASPHRIRRQRWRVRARSRDEAFEVRERLRAGWDDTLPVFEAAFDHAVPPDVVRHVPRLELHLRVASVDDLARRLPALLDRSLREQLQELGLSVNAETPFTTTGPSEAVLPVTREEDLLEALWTYLRHGALPWHRAHDQRDALVPQLSLVALREQERVFERLLGLVPGATGATPVPSAAARSHGLLAALFRWLQLLPESEWPHLAHLLATHLGGDPTRLADALGELTISTASRLSRAERLAFAAALLEERLQPSSTAAHDWRAATTRALGDPASPWGRAVRAYLLARVGDLTMPNEPPNPASALSVETGAPLRTPSLPRPVPIAAPRAERSVDFAIPVAHGGLVILHPFLPRLLAAAGMSLLSADAIDGAVIPRAAALLHYLATGEDEVWELDLGLVKLLLGVDPEAPLLVAGGLLSEEEKEEGEILLDTAIHYWKKLGSASSSSLRRTFLQREGVLQSDEMGWQLRVEPKGTDVLLDHLPWGIGTIKLPWMKKPLFTDWPRL